MAQYQTKAEPKAVADGIPVFCAHDKIEPIEVLVPNPRNPNQHPTEQLERLAEIIKAQGWRNPITVSNRSGMIVKGHGRLAAARILEVEAVPVDYQNYGSEAEEHSDLIADNRIAELAEMDRDLLSALLLEIGDEEAPVFLTGYSDEEYETITTAFSQTNILMNITDDTAPEATKEAFTEPGDIWVLGKHVLICGDSTQRQTFEILMGGDKADLIVTDPPYNVDYVGKTEEALTIQGDKQHDQEFRDFLLAAFKNMRKFARKGAAAYIFHSDTEGVAFRTAFEQAGFTMKQCLIWVKNVFVLGRQDYHWQHEPIIYGWLEGQAHYFLEDRTQSTVQEQPTPEIDKMKKADLIDFIRKHIPLPDQNTTILLADKPSRSAQHPTMKPVRLLSRLIANSSRVREIVMDPFGGSGSTMMACEHMKRRARCVEKDPRYCDVIVRRYSSITGRTEDVRCMRNGQQLDPSTFAFLLHEEDPEDGEQ